jgi:hypothetical protein
MDHRLATLVLPYDEWEVLYRQRLQVERDHLAGRLAQGGGDPSRGILGKIAEGVEGLLG